MFSDDRSPGRSARHFILWQTHSAGDHLSLTAGKSGSTPSRDYHVRDQVPPDGELRSNYEKPLRVEHLATIAGMSRSTLHLHFRALTAMSPLQFQKQLRLHAARQRLLMGELDAASAAFEVGYESPSQFNREYRRFFGRPPIRDTKALRDGKVVAITTA